MADDMRPATSEAQCGDEAAHGEHEWLMLGTFRSQCPGFVGRAGAPAHRQHDLDRWSEAMALDRSTGVTDDSCQGRCSTLLSWFIWETRGLMSAGEAHNVLDMVLNRLAIDRAAEEAEGSQKIADPDGVQSVGEEGAR